MLLDFTKMDVWKKAMDLAKQIHTMTAPFPKEELYGVTSQLRRASISVAANVAEGFGRYTAADKKHKYVQARGELVEVMTFLYHCESVGYISKEKRAHMMSLAEDIYKMLNALITKIFQRTNSES